MLMIPRFEYEKTNAQDEGLEGKAEGYMQKQKSANVFLCVF